MFNIVRLQNPQEKKKTAREILEALPEWFGIPESREEYIEKSAHHPFWCAYKDEKPIGFLYLSPTGRDTIELYVMGVLKSFHHKGIGTALFRAAYQFSKQEGYSFIQVKTVQMGKYEDYDRTNLFYLSLGFKEFEVFPTLWDEWNPCQVYVMSIK